MLYRDLTLSLEPRRATTLYVMEFRRQPAPQRSANSILETETSDESLFARSARRKISVDDSAR
jgi:hypothetical protein